MSDTKHLKEYTKHRIRGRANPYGLCHCSQCRANRNRWREEINQIKHKLRTWWKGGRQPNKGFYTD